MLKRSAAIEEAQLRASTLRPDETMDEVPLLNAWSLVVPYYSLVGAAIDSQELVAVPIAYADERYSPKADANDNERSPDGFLCGPLLDVSGASCGALRCAMPLDDAEPAFTPNQQQKLKRALPLFSMALRNAMSASRVLKDTTMAKTMASLAQMLIPGKVNIDDVVMLWGLQVCELLAADRCTFFLYSESDNKLCSYYAEGVDNFELQLDEIQAEKVGIAGYCANSKETINIKDAYADPRFNSSIDAATGYVTRSVLCMPFSSCSTGSLIGVCQVLNKRRPPGATFSREDEELLTTVLQIVGLVLENSHLAQGLERARKLRATG